MAQQETFGPSDPPRHREPPALFYTGLVAELYEPLVSEHACADDYAPFLERSGTPGLELACGSGLPLIELRARGLDVEGLDSSPDMLERCRARARERGVGVVLHQAEMQSFSLPRRYRSIFLAGASFTLLTSDDDARSALRCIHAHLEPGGAALIPLEIPDLEAERSALGVFRETRGAANERLRVATIEIAVEGDGHDVRRRLRYERIPAAGAAEVEVVERDWLRRSWDQDAFAAMLREAGFARFRMLAAGGGPAAADARAFVALASR